MQFDCQIHGTQLRCHITAHMDMAAPVFCFSLMAPPAAVSGGTLIHSDGGYGEMQLPDLQSGVQHEFVLRYADPAYHPANRAWLPLGAYLRHEAGCVALQPLPDGARKWLPSLDAKYDGLRILPQPSEWHRDAGSLSIQSIATKDDAFVAADKLGQRLGLPDLLSPEGLPVTIEKSPDIQQDAYGLAITADKISVTENGYGGRFYAAVTLLTLRATHPEGLPCGVITDAPRFDWRGQHLDCARHYYHPETICRLLDIMALCKLSRFHWHFADDEAFRLQVDCLPDLWQRTQMRGENRLIPNVFGGGIAAGGTYSKTDVAAVITHAKTLNIEIMPEIEVPAHALAMTRVYPETRDPDDVGTETSVQGYMANVLNPAMPATWKILHALVEEVANLFPFPCLHLGCDELPPDTWMGSPAARALMDREGLKTTRDLQGWTMARLAKQVVLGGRRPAAWEEAALGSNGGIGHNALLFSWSGQGPGIDAARAGYDVVMTPAQHVYLDMAQSSDPDDWGANWAGYVNLANTIDWDPLPEGADDVAGRIKGVQGAFWSEFTTQDDQIWPMLIPRILGVSAMAWQARDTLTHAQLTALASHYYRAVFTRF